MTWPALPRQEYDRFVCTQAAPARRIGTPHCLQGGNATRDRYSGCVMAFLRKMRRGTGNIPGPWWQELRRTAGIAMDLRRDRCREPRPDPAGAAWRAWRRGFARTPVKRRIRWAIQRGRLAACHLMRSPRPVHRTSRATQPCRARPALPAAAHSPQRPYRHAFHRLAKAAGSTRTGRCRDIGAAGAAPPLASPTAPQPLSALVSRPVVELPSSSTS